MIRILESVNQWVWGVPMLILILGVGVYFSFRTGFCQLRLLPKALGSFFCALTGKKKCGEQCVSGWEALCTALAATVGTGNIAGIAGAIALGGPGAVFWIWISAVFAMVTKFAEATLSVHFRNREPDGSFVGGPMYMIENGLGNRWKWLAGIYSFFGIFAAFGVGNATQVNAVIDSLHTALDGMGSTGGRSTDLAIGVVLSLLLGAVLLGGAKRIGRIAQLLVPLASAVYLLLGIGALIVYADRLPGVFRMILAGAMDPKAVTGGVICGSLQALRIGVSRGVFTNEAGMGTAGIAHASAEVKKATDQGLLGITEVFLDTVVICTITALVILSSEVPIVYGVDPGAALTAQAFESVYGGWVSMVLSACLCCFAFATMLGWGFYGIQCARYLLTGRSRTVFVLLQSAAVIASTVLGTGTAWLLADILNGLMAIPNLIALILLRNVFRRLVEQITPKAHRRSASGRSPQAGNKWHPVRSRGHASQESFHH